MLGMEVPLPPRVPAIGIIPRYPRALGAPAPRRRFLAPNLAKRGSTVLLSNNDTARFAARILSPGIPIQASKTTPDALLP